MSVNIRKATGKQGWLLQSMYVFLLLLTAFFVLRQVCSAHEYWSWSSLRLDWILGFDWLQPCQSRPAWTIRLNSQCDKCLTRFEQFHTPDWTSHSQRPAFHFSLLYIVAFCFFISKSDRKCCGYIVSSHSGIGIVVLLANIYSSTSTGLVQ